MTVNFSRIIKRSLDFLVAAMLLLLTLPLFVILSILIKLKMGGSVLFTQDRPGLNGKIFKIFKFRTMTNACDENGHLLPDNQRLTKLGKIIRSLSLDELPQLINVLKGDLSLVGPRPLLVQYLPLYSNEQKKRHHVKPGITGWAQINGRNSITWTEKFKLDVWYVENWSLGLDLKILLMTVKKVLCRSDIQQSENITMPYFNGKN